MKPKVSAHLSKIFNRLRGVNFNKLEELGQPNIQSMLLELEQSSNYWLDKLEKNEKDLEFLQGEKVFDSMEFTQESVLTAYLQLCYGNCRITLTSLKGLLSRMRKEKAGQHLPVFPKLRHGGYYRRGEDFMVYVSDDSYSKKYDWLYGKLVAVYDGYARIFLSSKFSSFSSPDESFGGRLIECKLDAPAIMKRNDLIKLKSLFTEKEKEEPDEVNYKYLFLRNCGYDGLKAPEDDISFSEIIYIFSNSRMETITDDTLHAKIFKVIKDAKEIMGIDLDNGF
jgi:hypothetical protein